MNIFDTFPAEWLCSVQVVSGRINSDGDWEGGETVVLDGCLFAPKSSENDNDYSSVVDGEGTLYVPSRHAGKISASSLVTVDAVLPGSYRVNGDIVNWPFGLVVNLVLEG